MNEPTESTPPTGMNRTAVAIAAFFFILIAFNVAFYVVALNNPVDLLPEPTSAAPPAAAAPRTP